MDNLMHFEPVTWNLLQFAYTKFKKKATRKFMIELQTLLDHDLLNMYASYQGTWGT